jgi:hypothetical protein
MDTKARLTGFILSEEKIMNKIMFLALTLPKINPSRSFQKAKSIIFQQYLSFIDFDQQIKYVVIKIGMMNFKG